MGKIGSNYRRCPKCGKMIIVDAMHIHVPSCESGEPDEPVDPEFTGYWYRNSQGELCHTWDYEVSIGEMWD